MERAARIAFDEPGEPPPAPRAPVPVPTPPELPVAPPPLVAAPEFRLVYEAQFSYVWHTLRRLGVHERDLEDVIHDVFVVYYRGTADYDPSRPIRPWLFGIAFRVASDYRRRAQHRREIPGEALEIADPTPAADEQVDAKDSRRLVLAALAALDLDRRAVFVMHELDGYSMPEIAQVMAVPLNTLYSRLRLAREQFAVAVRRLRLVATVRRGGAGGAGGGGAGAGGAGAGVGGVGDR